MARYVLVVAGLFQLKQTGGCEQTAVREQVVNQVGIHPRSGKDSDRSIEAAGRMSGVF